MALGPHTHRQSRLRAAGRRTHLLREVTSGKNCTTASRLWWWSDTELRARHSCWSCGEAGTVGEGGHSRLLSRPLRVRGPTTEAGQEGRSLASP